MGSERLGSGPGGSLASPSPPGPAHIPTLKHPRVRVQFSGWTQVRGRHGERAGRAIGPRGPLFPPPPPQGRARSPHRGFRLEQGGFPNSARSRRTLPAILSPHTAGALPFTHPEREEKARPRVLGRVSVVVEGDLSAADGHRAAVADPRHGTTADSEGPGAVSVWHVRLSFPRGLNKPGKGGGAWLRGWPWGGQTHVGQTVRRLVLREERRDPLLTSPAQEAANAPSVPCL